MRKEMTLAQYLNLPQENIELDENGFYEGDSFRFQILEADERTIIAKNLVFSNIANLPAENYRFQLSNNFSVAEENDYHTDDAMEELIGLITDYELLDHHTRNCLVLQLIPDADQLVDDFLDKHHEGYGGIFGSVDSEEHFVGGFYIYKYKY